MHPTGIVANAAHCPEKQRLMDDLLAAIHGVTSLMDEQTRAVIDCDPDFERFDVLLHDAQDAKDRAKYAWIFHVESHGCGE